MKVAFSHWSASWPVLIGYAILASAHLAGLRRLRTGGQAPARASGTGTRRKVRREAVLFQLGLALVTLALISPVGYWSGVYIWVRAVQELLVAVAGPGLIVLGAPAAAFGVPRGAGRWLMSRPLLTVVAANVIWLGWQLPALFDLARGSAGVAVAEHLSYIAAGIAFWLQLINSRPFAHRSSPLRRIGLLVGTVLASTIVGMVLVFGSEVLYPVYANSAHHVMTVLDDQQLSGAVLWMGMLPPLMIAGVALMMQWFSNEESAELSAGLDRLLTPRRHGWPTRPVIR